MYIYIERAIQPGVVSFRLLIILPGRFNIYLLQSPPNKQPHALRICRSCLISSTKYLVPKIWDQVLRPPKM